MGLLLLEAILYLIKKVLFFCVVPTFGAAITEIPEFDDHLLIRLKSAFPGRPIEPTESLLGRGFLHLDDQFSCLLII